MGIAKHRASRGFRPFARGDDGFSIVELSIILAIAAFVISNTLIITTAKKELEKVNESYGTLEQVKQALDRYAYSFGRYPCPAGFKVGPYEDNLGEEVCDVDGTEDEVNGVYRVASANGWADILIGAVPIKALDLPPSFMLDQYSNRFTYAVVKGLTDPTSYGAEIEGAISINSSQGFLSKKAAYVVVCHGENGIGAWNRGGTERNQPPIAGVYDGGELENNHLDPTYPWNNTFYFATRPLHDITGHRMTFDDVLVWSTQEAIPSPGSQDIGDTMKFSPDQLPSLFLWFDATDLETITKDVDDHVTLWKDKTRIFNNSSANDAVADNINHYPLFIESGNNDFDPTAAKKPLPSIRFSQGENDALTVTGGNSVNTSHLTLFVVAYSNSDGLPDRKMFMGRGISHSDNASYNWGWGFGSTTSNHMRGFWMDDSTDADKRVDTTEATDFYDTPQIWVAEYNGNYWDFGLIKYYQACEDKDQQIYTAPTLVPLGNFPIIIGAQYMDASFNGIYSLEGDIGEIVGYGTPLSDYDRERVTRYLAKKWGISSSSCNLEKPQCLQGTLALGAACTSNSECCSEQCSNSGKCCRSTDYTKGQGLELCTKNSDCCDPNATCSLYGFCWTP